MPSPYYKDGTVVAKKERDELWEIIYSLKETIPYELYLQLNSSMTRVDQACIPTVPISRAGSRVGMGLSKSQKAIACDQMSAIIKQIKALKAWQD
jgi:hypothetical protein